MLNFTSTAGLEVGMVLDGTGISTDGIRTIATIVDGDTITVDSAITSKPVGTVIEFTQSLQIQILRQYNFPVQ